MPEQRADSIPEKILIVDDLSDNLNMLSEVLEPVGYQIHAVLNGETALRVAHQEQPDLILLDVVMEPGLDGFETCKRLKADETTKDIPIVFITVKDETASIVKGFHLGAVDYITRPFKREEVLARVRTHLTIKHLQDALEASYRQLAADNVRKTEELEYARTIQEGFLPADVPKLSYLDIFAFQRPATEVGGDYYDFFPLDGRKLLIAIGDATGHGVGPGLMVAPTKMALLTVDETDLTARVNRINQLLKKVNQENLLNMALVLLELAYDVDTQTLHVEAAGGGMPLFYMLRADGSVEEVAIIGMPLGALAGETYESTQFQLQKSDTLLLMSDGLPERLNEADEMLGTQRLQAEIQALSKRKPNVRELTEALVQLGDQWSSQPQDDDVTLVVLKVK